MIASFSMNTIWPRCLNVTSSRSSVNAWTKSVLSSIWIPNRKYAVSRCSLSPWQRWISNVLLFISDCPWYDRGFCRHGPNCKNRHTRKVLCQNYLCGFCPEGPRCTLSHPTFELPNSNEHAPVQRKVIFVCDYCHETGHKASSCFKLPYEERQKYLNMPSNNMHSQGYNRLPLAQHQNSHHNHHDGAGGPPPPPGMFHPGDDQYLPTVLSQPFQHDVTCFKCGERGYVAGGCHSCIHFLLLLLVTMPTNVHDLMVRTCAIRIFHGASGSMSLGSFSFCLSVFIWPIKET